MEKEIITSTQNPKIKRLIQLQQKSSERKSAGLFVVEGAREVLHCVHSGYALDTLFVCPEILEGYEGAAELLSLVRQGHGYEVSPKVYRRVAYREGTEGVIAQMKVKTLRLDDLDLPENPLLMVLERVEKPGNLGAVLRSADAAAADAVIVCDVACSSEECIGFLKRKGIQILTAQLQDSSLYYDTDMRRGTAIVMGTESTGLTNIWRNAADAHIRIPMKGQLDSLNVSVSAAILLFEAVRQRG